jgi:hypothetical protein
VATEDRLKKADNLLEKLKACVEKGNYSITDHAFQRQQERIITVPECLYVLTTGYEEKSKSRFDAEHNSWKYAIRGQTLRKADIRIIVAFDEDGVLIITVMHVGRL